MTFDEARHNLLTETTSRLNKVHCAISWAHFYGWDIAWRWSGTPFRSRVEFAFDGRPFLAARSYDDDVRPLLKFNGGANCEQT